MTYRLNKTIVACVLLLSGMGLLCLWSQAPPTDLAGKPVTQSIFLKQVTFLGVALAVMGLVAWPHYLNWRHLSYVLYAVLLVMLVVLLIKGRVTNGAKCWFNVGPIKFQPAEIMKVASSSSWRTSSCTGATSRAGRGCSSRSRSRPPRRRSS